jgi:hypothetical protein
VNIFNKFYISVCVVFISVQFHLVSLRRPIEVGGTLSTANVSFSWTVSPVPDSQTIQFYTYRVKYRQNSSSAWTNITVKQNWTSVTVSLQRNVAYTFSVTPVRTLNGVTEPSNTSFEYQYTPGTFFYCNLLS